MRQSRQDLAGFARPRCLNRRGGGVRHLFAALELGSDKMYGHIKKRKRRGEFLEFCRYLRSLHPAGARIAIVCDYVARNIIAVVCPAVLCGRRWPTVLAPLVGGWALPRPAT